MPKATLTSKGQLTLPKEVRARLGVDTGDQVVFTIADDGSVTVVAAKRPATRLFGMLRAPSSGAVSVEDMDQAIADGVASDDDRVRSRKP